MAQDLAPGCRHPSFGVCVRHRLQWQIRAATPPRSQSRSRVRTQRTRPCAASARVEVVGWWFPKQSREVGGCAPISSGYRLHLRRRGFSRSRLPGVATPRHIAGRTRQEALQLDLIDVDAPSPGSFENHLNCEPTLASASHDIVDGVSDVLRQSGRPSHDARVYPLSPRLTAFGFALGSILLPAPDDILDGHPIGGLHGCRPTQLSCLQ